MPKRISLTLASFLLMGLFTELFGVVSMPVAGSIALAAPAASYAYGWGHNLYGQLGNGTLNYISAPLGAIRLPSGVRWFTNVAAGSFHSLGIGNDGKLYAWGNNQAGALGIGYYTFSSFEPVAVQLFRWSVNNNKVPK